MRERDSDYGIPGRHGPGYAAVLLSSIVTSAIVSVACVYALTRYAALPGLPPAASLEDGRPSEPVRVPDVVGMAAESADELLSARRLRFVVRERRADGRVAAGSVIVQTPLAQSRIEAGGEVEVVVSTGPESIKVPDLMGMSLEDAQRALEGAGLTLASVLDIDRGEPGKVSAMAPPAGSALGRGAGVTLSVARPSIAVPRLLNAHISEAREKIKKAGLSVGEVLERYDSRKRGNLVLSQEPPPGTPVALGTQIDLIINQGD